MNLEKKNFNAFLSIHHCSICFSSDLLLITVITIVLIYSILNILLTSSIRFYWISDFQFALKNSKFHTFHFNYSDSTLFTLYQNQKKITFSFARRWLSHICRQKNLVDSSNHFYLQFFAFFKMSDYRQIVTKITKTNSLLWQRKDFLIVLRSQWM